MANQTRNLERSDTGHEEQNQPRTLPILPVRDTVLFPHAVLPLTVGRETSVQLINSLGEDKTIVVVAQREARVDVPQPSDLYALGTLAVVHKVVKMPNQSLFVFAEGLERVKVTNYEQLQPFMRATGRNYQFSQGSRRQNKYPGVNVGEGNDASGTGHHQVRHQHCCSAKCRDKPAHFAPCAPRGQHDGREIKKRDSEVGSLVINPANQQHQQSGFDYCRCR